MRSREQTKNRGAEDKKRKYTSSKNRYADVEDDDIEHSSEDRMNSDQVRHRRTGGKKSRHFSEENYSSNIEDDDDGHGSEDRRVYEQPKHRRMDDKPKRVSSRHGHHSDIEEGDFRCRKEDARSYKQSKHQKLEDKKSRHTSGDDRGTDVEEDNVRHRREYARSYKQTSHQRLEDKQGRDFSGDDHGSDLEEGEIRHRQEDVKSYEQRSHRRMEGKDKDSSGDRPSDKGKLQLESQRRHKQRHQREGKSNNFTSRDNQHSDDEEGDQSVRRGRAKAQENEKRCKRTDRTEDIPDKGHVRYSKQQSNGEEKRSRQRNQHHEGESENRARDEAEGEPVTNNTANDKTVVDNEDESYMKAKRARLEETLTTKTGGAYIPPARLRMMQGQITDKSSVAYQRLAWEALKKSINGLINKANTSNLIHIVKELLQENIIRGRGLLARSVMQAQAASPTFTHVYAALVAIINTKFPQIGELILKRLIIQFRKGYRRNDKNLCLSAARFIAHLVNQRVAHEVLSLEILHVLLERPTNDSVELAIGFLKECGQLLSKVSPKGVNAVFERLRTILHEALIDKRVQYMIEVMFAVRKDGFKDHPAVVQELELVEEDDQITHLLALENADNPEDGLNVFKADDNFLLNNEKYNELKREILGESSSDEDVAEGYSRSGSSDSDEDSGGSGEDEEKKTTIIDSTETNLISLRRTIYLTIQSSLDFEECAHKLLKMQLKPGQEAELCNMILDCCSQQRTFEKFYGLLAQRFCMMEKKYVEPFQQMFTEQYEFVHRLETNKLRNIAKLFAHLLHTDAISWEVLQCIHLNEDETTSSSRIFIKILFQELCEFMGLTKLNNRLKDPTLQVFFEGLFPRDNPRNTRFSINFFTSIGLGGLTDELRAHLKTVPKPIPQQTAAADEDASSSSSSSSSADSDSSDSSEDSDSSSSSSSEEEEKKPVPTRLSEFFRDHQNKQKTAASSRDNEKDTAQRRLLALANYGDEEVEVGNKSSKHSAGNTYKDQSRHGDDGDVRRRDDVDVDDRKKNGDKHKPGSRRQEKHGEPEKSRHGGHEHKSKKRSRSRERRR